MQRLAKIIVLTPILTQLYATLSLPSQFQNEEFSPALPNKLRLQLCFLFVFACLFLLMCFFFVFFCREKTLRNSFGREGGTSIDMCTNYLLEDHAHSYK